MKIKVALSALAVFLFSSTAAHAKLIMACRGGESSCSSICSSLGGSLSGPVGQDSPNGEFYLCNAKIKQAGDTNSGLQTDRTPPDAEVVRTCRQFDSCTIAEWNQRTNVKASARKRMESAHGD